MAMILTEQQRRQIEMYALLNAVEHSGKAEVGAVVGKVMGATPELRSSSREVAAALKRLAKLGRKASMDCWQPFKLRVS